MGLESNLNRFFRGATAPGSGVLSTGGQTLAQILQSQGKTDPRLFNMQSAGISRDTQALQQALQGSLARSGMQGSGVGLAMGTSIGQAGANQQAGLRANEAQLQEARKRSDLDLLMQMILGPAQQQYGMQKGFQMQDRSIEQQREAARWQAIASLIGGVVPG